MKKRSIGRVESVQSNLRPLQITNPLSRSFDPPVGDKPGDLFKYLMVCQHNAYGQTILKTQPNQHMHTRHLKYLLKTYDPLTIKRAILYASLRCDYPYGIRWIKFYCSDMDNLMERDND